MELEVFRDTTRMKFNHPRGPLCNVLLPNKSPNHVFQTKLENISLKDVMNSVEM